MDAAEKKELQRRAALTQAALASLDPQKLLRHKLPGPAYERDAREIAQAATRFQNREDLGLAILKILQKHYGKDFHKFDSFGLADRLLKLFALRVE